MLTASRTAANPIDEVKDLQRQWQAVGPVPRDEDPLIACGKNSGCIAMQCFKDGNRSSPSTRHPWMPIGSQAIARCAMSSEALLNCPGPRCCKASAACPSCALRLRPLVNFLGAWRASCMLGLSVRWNAVKRQFDRQQLRDTEQSWSDLLDAGNRVRAYRLALVGNADPAERDGLRQAAEDYIASVNQWPKGGHEAMKTARSRVPGMPILPANEQVLRLLCVRAEILAERVRRPPEDQGVAPRVPGSAADSEHGAGDHGRFDTTGHADNGMAARRPDRGEHLPAAARPIQGVPPALSAGRRRKRRPTGERSLEQAWRGDRHGPR